MQKQSSNEHLTILDQKELDTASTLKIAAMCEKYLHGGRDDHHTTQLIGEISCQKRKKIWKQSVLE
jgi:hypothetical protein